MKKWKIEFFNASMVIIETLIVEKIDGMCFACEKAVYVKMSEYFEYPVPAVVQ